MNKSNVMELKKTLKITTEFMPSIDRICTCFVNGNKEKLISNTESYSSLGDEEQFKYIDILKAALSGTIDKKLLNLEFGSNEASIKAEGFMTEAYTEVFKSEEKRDELFDTIIENYIFDENYLIVAGHGVYDVPMKASDGAILEDETTTYEFMLVAICPVHSTKAGLTLDSDSGRMVSSRQVQIVQAPVHGFLYPAFNDRDTDLHSMLYFTKKPEDSHPELIEKLLGIPAPTSSVDQQHIFESIIAEVTDDKADFEVIKTLHENLKEMEETAQYNGEIKTLHKEEIKEILVSAGVKEEKLDDFEHIYERAGGNDDTEFKTGNLIELDKFAVKSSDVEIKIKPDRTNLVQQRKIDGRNCIVVALEGDVRLNGIQINAPASQL